MTSAEIIKLLRDTGLTHGELAEQAGVARETLSRWQTGAQRPSLEELQRVVEAAGAELEVRMTLPETKLIELANDQLDRGPSNRLELLLGKTWPACRRALQAAANAGDLAVLIGPVAAAIQGAPQRPGNGRVDLLVPLADREEVETWLMRGDAFPDGVEQSPHGGERRTRWQAGSGALTVRSWATGPAAFEELRARARPVGLKAGTVYVALVEDLLDLAEHSPWPEDTAYLAGLRAVLAAGRYVSREPRAA